MNGIQEVSGSIPLISTKHPKRVQKTVETTRFQRFFCCLQGTAKQDFLRLLVRLIFDQKILNQGDRKMKKIKKSKGLSSKREKNCLACSGVSASTGFLSFLGASTFCMGFAAIMFCFSA